MKMKKSLMMFCLLMISVVCFGQEKPKAPAVPEKVEVSKIPEGAPMIAPDDKFKYRTSQLQTLQTYQALTQTAEYKAFEAAQKGQQAVWTEVMNHYKVDPQKFTLCDSMSVQSHPVCAGIAAGEIEFRSIIKEPPKK